jgi:hypothetical protein
MRIKAFFMTVITGLAVLSGICKGLSAPRRAKEAEGERKRETEGTEETRK